MPTTLVTPTYIIDDHGNKYKVINWKDADCAIEAGPTYIPASYSIGRTTNTSTKISSFPKLIKCN